MPHAFRRFVIGLSAAGAVGAAASASAQQAGPAVDILGDLHWRSVGPTNNAGRVSVMAGVPGDPYTYYVSGANGGIIKTINGGTTLTPIFDKQDIGRSAPSRWRPSNPDDDLRRHGRGEPAQQRVVRRRRVPQSIDGGETWTHIGLGRLGPHRAHRHRRARNPDVVYVCAMGHEWGPSDERGVYKTTDGGKNWKRMLFVDSADRCSDIDADPEQLEHHLRRHVDLPPLGVAPRQRRRQTALYKSVDGGDDMGEADQTASRPSARSHRTASASRGAPATIVVYMVSETPKTRANCGAREDAGATGGTSARIRTSTSGRSTTPTSASIRTNPEPVYSLSGIALPVGGRRADVRAHRQ